MEIMMSSNRQSVGDPLSAFARPNTSSSTRSVDVFVRPPADGGGQSEALLNALSGIDKALNPVLKKETRQAAQKDIEEGEALFQANRKDFGDAVRSGEIPAGASPFVRRGYRQSQLHVLGATYNVELQRALEHSNLSEVEDPAEVEQFIQAFNAEYEKENGIGSMPAREVADYYRPAQVRAHDSFRNEQADRNIKLVEERRARSFEQELYMAVSQGNFSGPPGSAAANAQNLQQWLQARSQDFYEEGVEYDVIEAMVLNTVGEVALERNSHAVAGLLNGISIAGMPPIGSSANGRKLRGRISSQIAAAEQRRSREAAASVKSSEALSKNQLMAAAQRAAISGNFEEARDLNDRLMSVDPTKARSVDSFIRRYEGDDEEETDGNFGNAIRDSIRNAPSKGAAQDIIDEASVYNGLSPSASNDLYTYAERIHGGMTGTDPISLMEGDKAVQTQRKAIDEAIPLDDGYSKIPNAPAQRNNAAAAYDDYMIDWYTENTDADGNYSRLAARLAAQAALAYSINSTSNSSGGDTTTALPSWATE